MSGYSVVQRTFQLVPDNPGIIDVSCPLGKVVIAAGARSTSFNYGVIIAGSYPVSSTTWRFELKNPFSAWNNGVLFAVCVTVAA